MVEIANVDDLSNQREAGLFMWEFCQWICKQGQFETTYYWHDILTNSELQAFMSDRDLVLQSYLRRDNIYRPFLRRIIEGLSERGYFREEKTGEMSNIDGEEIIEYLPRPILKENCNKFLKYGTANIDDINKMD